MTSPISYYGRQPTSPLGEAMGSFSELVQMLVGVKMEQERREAQQEHNAAMLELQERKFEAEVETRQAVEQLRKERGFYEPPEAGFLRDNITRGLRILNDPRTYMELDDEDIMKRWENIKQDQTDHFGMTGRHLPIRTPLSVDRVLAKPPEPAPVKAAPKRKAKELPAPRIGETRAGYRRRIEEPVLAAPAGLVTGETRAVEIPPGFPDPSGLPENQTATFNGEPWIIRNRQWVRDK